MSLLNLDHMLVLAIACAALFALLVVGGFFADGHAARLWWTVVEHLSLSVLLWAFRVMHNGVTRHKRAGTQPGEASLRFYTFVLWATNAATVILEEARRHLPVQECH